MTAVGWLPADAEELFGADATAEESYDLLTVDVPSTSWITALETARDRLGCTYFDWLSAVDEPGTGFRVAAHVVALGPVRRLLLRTTVPHEAPVLPTAVGVYAGAAWHERETHEMFGVSFEDHPALDHLLLPEGFEGHPLRKDFVLAARVAKAWPGAKEPGESDHGGPRRRQMLPPGVPDPNEWGPLKGQLPPAPARPARGAGRAAGERPARAAGERPARRTRTAAEGSVGQQAETPVGQQAETPVGQQAETPGAEAPTTPRRSRTAAEGSASQSSPGGEPTGTPGAEASATPRRSRTAAEGSASQNAPAGEPAAAPAPRRSRSASQGSASQRAVGPADGPTTPATEPTGGSTGDTAAGRRGTAGTAGPRRARSASQGSASQRAAADAGQPDDAGPGSAPRGGKETGTASSPAAEPARKPTPSTPRSSDAPWHHARPAFDEPEATEKPGVPEEPADTSDGPKTPGGPDAPEEPDAARDPDASEGPDAAEVSDTADGTEARRKPPNSPGGPQ
ncbi:MULTISPECIES: NADH-quinone oxidoreductase subunit C [Streptomyces]|uniref:NADH-quinone oxidoreductase subunit C n=1 Tax=Streptomyces TaxID=1883 RepID=UPI0012909EDF|nr:MULTISPECIES: NADH-quinone oxidoreductase subunit C [Streptomyces]MCX5036035.1 NADH-quinone oxidoreductase subunit C [Streptomyces coelicoflavus]QFX82298.1 NADH-quinone oxidoreductase subunit C [Streptomyces sp. SYP-A7193]